MSSSSSSGDSSEPSSDESITRQLSVKKQLISVDNLDDSDESENKQTKKAKKAMTHKVRDEIFSFIRKD